MSSRKDNYGDDKIPETLDGDEWLFINRGRYRSPPSLWFIHICREVIHKLDI